MTVEASLKALVTVSELVAYVNWAQGNLSADQQDALQRLVNGVSTAVEGYCRVPLIKAAATEYYNGGRERIVLRRAPVDTGESFTVLEDGTALTRAADGSSKTAGGVDPDFWLEPETGALTRNGTWADGIRIVTITYTAGLGWQYTTGDVKRTATAQALVTVDIPDDLREAVLIICKAHTDLGMTNWGGQVVGETVMRPAAWPKPARDFLDRGYAMPVVR